MDKSVKLKNSRFDQILANHDLLNFFKEYGKIKNRQDIEFLGKNISLYYIFIIFYIYFA